MGASGRPGRGRCGGDGPVPRPVRRAGQSGAPDHRVRGGRVVLVVAWMWLGWHAFARYPRPHRWSIDGSHHPGDASWGHGRRHGGGPSLRRPRRGTVSRPRWAVVLAASVVLAVTAASCSSAPGSSAPPAPVRLASDPFAHAPGATTLAGTGTARVQRGRGPGRRRRARTPRAGSARTGPATSSSPIPVTAGYGRCRPGSGGSFGVSVHAGDIVTVAGGPCTGPSPIRRPPLWPSTGPATCSSPSAPAPGSRSCRTHRHPVRHTGHRRPAGHHRRHRGAGIRRRRGPGSARRARRSDRGWRWTPPATCSSPTPPTAACAWWPPPPGSRYGVRVVAGHIDTVAGTGVCGSGGGRRAGRSRPSSGTPVPWPWTAGGNVLVADQGNRTIRLLAATDRHVLRGDHGRRSPGHGGR